MEHFVTVQVEMAASQTVRKILDHTDALNIKLSSAGAQWVHFVGAWIGAKYITAVSNNTYKVPHHIYKNFSQHSHV